MKNPLESKIENYLKQQIARIGGLCYKFKSTVNGVPDQLIVYGGGLYLVEVKRPGESPRADQVNIHRKIHDRGVTVYTVDTNQTIDEFIKNVLNAEVPVETAPTAPTVIQSSDAFKLN